MYKGLIQIQLYIPPLKSNLSNIDNTFGKRCQIKFLGEEPPNQTENSTAFNFTYTKKGVIIESTLASANGTAPAIFGGIDTISVFGTFNYNYISFENLAIISNYNSISGAVIGGINAANIASTEINNCVITINRTFKSSVKPINEIAGIIMAKNAGDAVNSIRNTSVQGFKYGIVLGEHCVLDQVSVGAASYAFIFGKATHATYAGRIYTASVAIDIAFPDSTYLNNLMDNGSYIPTAFHIDELDSEIDTGSFDWWDHVVTVFDRSSYGRGIINGIIIQSGSGAYAPSKFTKYYGDSVFLHWLTYPYSFSEITGTSNVTQLSNTQINSGAKIFNDQTFLLRNPANTQSYTLVGSAITAPRTLRLPNIIQTDTLQVQPGFRDKSGQNPLGTASLTGVMAGLSILYTPKSTGRILVLVDGIGTNSVGDNGFFISVNYGTGTAPSNGNTATGTNIGNGLNYSVIASGTTANTSTLGFSRHGFVTGLAIGTTYWFDLAFGAISGGTATFSNTNITVIEL